MGLETCLEPLFDIHDVGGGGSAGGDGHSSPGRRESGSGGVSDLPFFYCCRVHSLPVSNC